MTTSDKSEKPMADHPFKECPVGADICHYSKRGEVEHCGRPASEHPSAPVEPKPCKGSCRICGRPPGDTKAPCVCACHPPMTAPAPAEAQPKPPTCEHKHTDRCSSLSRSHFEYCEACGAVRMWTMTIRGEAPDEWHSCPRCKL